MRAVGVLLFMHLIQKMIVVRKRTNLFDKSAGERVEGMCRTAHPCVAEKTRCWPGGAVRWSRASLWLRVALAPHFHQTLTLSLISSLILFYLQHELSRQRGTYRLRGRAGRRP